MTFYQITFFILNGQGYFFAASSRAQTHLHIEKKSLKVDRTCGSFHVAGIEVVTAVDELNHFSFTSAHGVVVMSHQVLERL